MERPEVTIHFAQTLDGHIDRPADAESAVISNAQGFIEAHRARAAHDAVLVGIGTVLRDDPKLRVSRVSGQSPHRIVLDSRLRTPWQAKLLDPAGGERVIIVGCHDHCAPESLRALRSRGAEVVLLGRDSAGRVELAELLPWLARRGIRRLLVEGGAQVIAAFLTANAVDRMSVEVAPRFLGAMGLPAMGRFPLGVDLSEVRIEPLGTHVLISGTPKFT